MATLSKLPEDILDAARAVEEVSREWKRQCAVLQETLHNARARADALLYPIRRACKDKQAALEDATKRVQERRFKQMATRSAALKMWNSWNPKIPIINEDDAACLDELKARLDVRLNAWIVEEDEAIQALEEEVRQLIQWLTPVRGFLASVEFTMLCNEMEPSDQTRGTEAPQCYMDCGNFAPFPGGKDDPSAYDRIMRD